MSGLLLWSGVAVFGAFGGLVRFGVDTAVSRRRPSDFPWGTLVVNLTGSFVLGLLVGASLGTDALFVAGTGFLGGYTTFSTWMVETERLGEEGELRLLAINWAMPMAAGLVVTGAGWLIGAALR